MFSFTRSARKLINNKYLNSLSITLLNRSHFILKTELRLTNNASLSTRPYLISSYNCDKAKLDYYLENRRYFSKKKSTKRTVEIEEESDSDEEQNEQTTADDEILGDNIIKKNVPSLRLDSVIKAGLGLTKKKIEQEFYAFKLRVNGQPVVKKALNVYVGDELDVVNGFSPETSKYLIVDRIIVKGIDKVTATGQFPVKMEVLKKLTIENYEEPWNPSAVGQLDK